MGIVQNQSIWASSPQMLNDISEVQFGAKLMKSVWHELRTNGIPEPCVQFVDRVLDRDFGTELGSKIFIASASSEPDLLNQWAHYGGSDGFAVGINTGTEIATHGDDEEAFQVSEGLPIIEGWYRVIYDEAEQREALKKLLLFTASITPGTPEEWGEHLESWPKMVNTASFTLQSLLAQLKHPAFADEREVRYIAALPNRMKPKFRTAGGHLIPYVELKRAQMRFDAKENGRFIEKIYLGPNVRSGTAEVVERLVDSCGLRDIGLIPSEIPYLARRL